LQPIKPHLEIADFSVNAGLSKDEGIRSSAASEQLTARTRHQQIIFSAANQGISAIGAHHKLGRQRILHHTTTGKATAALGVYKGIGLDVLGVRVLEDEG
jgi:hypothetical protein